MEDAIRTLIMFIIYPLLIVIFHLLGKYPSKLVSPRSIKRECGGAIIVFGVYLIIYWLRTPVSELISKSLQISGQLGTSWTVGNIFLLIASLCLLIVVEKGIGKRELSAIGFKLPINRKVLLAFAGVVVAYLIYEIIGLVSGLQIQAYMFVSAVILVPLAEEVVFRSMIQTRLEAGLGSVKSWILSGLLFGVYHFYAWFIIGTSTQFTIPQLVWTAIFGMASGVIFVKTRSLFPSFILHAVNNFLAYLV